MADKYILIMTLMRKNNHLVPQRVLDGVNKTDEMVRVASESIKRTAKGFGAE